MMALHTQMVELHIGRALNKTLKDIIMKYKTMTGHYNFAYPWLGYARFANRACGY